MGSLRAPVAVAAAAAIAWIAVALDVGVRDRPSEVRRLVPGASAAAIAAIEVRRGEDSFRARRDGDRWIGPDDAAVDPEAVDTLLGAIEHTWVRRLRPGAGGAAELGLDAPTAITAITLESGAARTLGLGVELADRDLVWVATGGDAALITATEARQLFLPPGRLRERRPFRADAVDGLEITAGDRRVSASGDRSEVAIAGGRARIDTAELEGLLEALRSLSLEPGRAGQPAPPLVIRLSGGGWIEVDGRCAGRPDAVAVRSGVGAGCVAAAPLERARVLAAAPGELVEDRLVDPRRQVASARLRRGADEVVIDPGGPGRAAALAWLADLAAAASGPPRPLSSPPGEPAAAVEIRYATGEPDQLAIWRSPEPLIRRGSEPVVFPAAGAAELLAAEPVWFRAPELIERDPTELVSARRGGQPLKTAAIAPLVAHLSAERFAAARPAPAHGLARPRAVIDLEFSPPPIDTGEPDAYRLTIGAPAPDGCFARLSPGDGAVFVLAPAVCDALLAE